MSLSAPGPGGSFLSQNFLKKGESYNLSVAVSFSGLHPHRQGPALYHPLYAGSRFGDTVSKQVRDHFGLGRGDPGCPEGMWSFGKWRSNTLPLLARGLAVNDQVILPKYLEALHPGKHRLVALFEAACEIIPRLEPDVPVIDQVDRFGMTAEALQACRGHISAAAVEALTLSRGGHCYQGFGPETSTVDLDSISPTMMALFFADVLRTECKRLPEILAMVQSL